MSLWPLNILNLNLLVERLATICERRDFNMRPQEGAISETWLLKMVNAETFGGLQGKFFLGFPKMLSFWHRP